MTSHFFLLSDTLTTERLSWLEESLKFYFIQIYPESLMYQATAKSPVFTFLLTGDALTSLENPETQKIWSVILSLNAVGIICDREEMDLRGISIDQIRMRNPCQVIDQNSPTPEKPASFWNDVVVQVREKKPLLHRKLLAGWHWIPRICTGQRGMASGSSLLHCKNGSL